ncbi:eCIS core domain-containing protein [Phytohabitans sp. LJ34]|uniref:eCIS core domain-containing protein n=1 Tax=Phytohabitans sp. LJ34 TaxID=3452217 RepID=UPI003F8B8FFA
MQKRIAADRQRTPDAGGSAARAPGGLAHLQHTLGNQAVRALVRHRAEYERDAARGILPPAGPSTGPAPAPPVGVLAELGAGVPLPEPDRLRWERETAADLSTVRVHRDGRAAAAAAGLHARAFTVGEHIAFGAGRYAPGTGPGDRLLRHELAHVLQQRAAGVPLGPQLAPIGDPLDLLTEEPIPVPRDTEVAPPGRALLKDATGNKFLVRTQIFDVRDLPDTPEINQLQMHVKGLDRNKPLTMATLRAEAQQKGRVARAMLGRQGGRLILVAADTWVPPPHPAADASRGWVHAAEESRGAGQIMLANRIRETLRASRAGMSINISDSADAMRFHERVYKTAGKEGPMGRAYHLDRSELMRVLAAFDPSMDENTRRILREKPPATAKELEEVLARNRGPAIQLPTGRQEKAQAGASAAVGALSALAAWFNSRFRDKQSPQVEAALAPYAQAAAAHMAQRPHDGALFRMAYREASLPDTTITGPMVFDRIEVGYGRTPEEAMADILAAPAAMRTPGEREQLRYEEVWQEPKAASGPADLRTPFPRRMLATARGRTMVLQDVKWDLDGFDDEGSTSVAVGAADSLSFFVLAVPRRIAHHTIPVGEVPVAGGAAPAVNLDPANPFNVHAVAVFPANEATRAAFEQAPGLALKVPFPVRANLSLLRWVRPDQILLPPAP